MFHSLMFLPRRLAGDSPAAAKTAEPETEDNAQPVPDALKDALLKAVDERARRAESAVVRSMAEQNGVSEETLAALLEETRAVQTAALPAETQERLDAMTADVSRRLRLAEVKSVGADMGLVDAEVALSLLDTDALTVDGDGGVTGVREALEALKERKGYLFARPARGAWAQRVSAGGAPQASGVEEAFYRKNPALRR